MIGIPPSSAGARNSSLAPCGYPRPSEHGTAEKTCGRVLVFVWIREQATGVNARARAHTHTHTHTPPPTGPEADKGQKR